MMTYLLSFSLTTLHLAQLLYYEVTTISFSSKKQITHHSLTFCIISILRRRGGFWQMNLDYVLALLRVPLSLSWHGTLCKARHDVNSAITGQSKVAKLAAWQCSQMAQRNLSNASVRTIRWTEYKNWSKYILSHALCYLYCSMLSSL